VPIKKFETVLVQIKHPFYKGHDLVVMSLYEGETLNGHPEGFGRIKYVHNNNKKDFLSFTGVAEFKNKQMNGFSFIIGGVKYLRICQTKNGLRNGPGVTYRPNGVRQYLGEFKDSMRHE
jgi:antitoxin component YwqK of YwqJK toxin-antitoxin module